MGEGHWRRAKPLANCGQVSPPVWASGGIVEGAQRRDPWSRSGALGVLLWGVGSLWVVLAGRRWLWAWPWDRVMAERRNRSWLGIRLVGRPASARTGSSICQSLIGSSVGSWVRIAPGGKEGGAEKSPL